MHTVNIYTQKNILICLDNDSSLYLYNYEKMNKKMGIADEVSYVGDAVTQEDIKASFKHGILKLEVPKKEKKPEIEKKNYVAIEG